MIASIIYGLFLLYVVARLFKPVINDETTYLLSGRAVTLPAFVATTVSSWYGGILGVGEYSYNYGISNWLVFGVPYYLYALIFALVIAKKAREKQVMTMPDQLRDSFGPKVSYLASIMIFIMTAPAAYVLALGVLLGYLFGISLPLAVIFGTIVSLVYVYRGGLNGVIFTDKVQFVLMFLGFSLLLPASVLKLGGPSWLLSSLPNTHLQLTGGQGIQAVAVWYVIAASTLVEPAFYQRCYAAKDAKTARNGLLLSIAFWVFFDFLTTASGLYAKAALPQLTGTLGAQGSYLELADLVLPSYLVSIFVVGLLATIMSTIDSYAFIAAVTFGRDILWRATGAKGDSNRFSKIGLVVTGLVSIGMALWKQSIVGLWRDLGSIGAPVLLVPVIFSFTKIKVPETVMLLAMTSGGLVSTLSVLKDHFLGTPLFNLEPIFPGLGLSISIIGIGLFLKKRL